jgi:hypothetical protein
MPKDNTERIPPQPALPDNPTPTSTPGGAILACADNGSGKLKKQTSAAPLSRKIVARIHHCVMNLPKTIDGGHEPSLHIWKTPNKLKNSCGNPLWPITCTLSPYYPFYQFYLETKYDLVMLPENR